MGKKLQKLRNRPLQSDRVIVCEGTDEFDIFCLIRESENKNETDVEFIDAGGRSNLLNKIEDLYFETGGSNLKLVVVVMDSEERSNADVTLAAELRRAVERRNWSYQEYLLPDANSPGALETFVRRKVQDETSPARCANNWESCIKEGVDSEKWTQAQKDKAWSHVWLAGQGEFYSRIGYAIAKNSNLRSHMQEVVKHFEKIFHDVITTKLNNT